MGIARIGGDHNLILTNKNSTPFYQFEHLLNCDLIQHAIFTRNNGCSLPPFDSLNVSFGLGDKQRNVLENRRTIAACVNDADLVFSRQVHGDTVVVLDEKAEINRIKDDSDAFTGDALVTNMPGKFIVIQTADCQSIVLYDSARNVVANIHSGWRGSIGNIIGRTVAAMQNRFGSSSGDIRAGIGPSLGPCCAEFVNYRREIPKGYWKYNVGNNRFDFWAMSRDQLVACGIPLNNISVGNICTRCNTELFFSYRGEKVTGRFASLIGLKARG